MIAEAETKAKEAEKVKGGKGGGGPVAIGADELQPVICYVVARAKVRHMASQADYLYRFREAYPPCYDGKTDYAVTMFESAALYLGHMAANREVCLSKIMNSLIEELGS